MNAKNRRSKGAGFLRGEVQLLAVEGQFTHGHFLRVVAKEFEFGSRRVPIVADVSQADGAVTRRHGAGSEKPSVFITATENGAARIGFFQTNADQFLLDFLIRRQAGDDFLAIVTAFSRRDGEIEIRFPRVEIFSQFASGDGQTALDSQGC